MSLPAIGLTDVELVAILTVGGSAWLLWKGPRAIRRVVGRWLGTRRDADDRVYEEYRRRQVARAARPCDASRGHCDQARYRVSPCNGVLYD